MLIFRKMREFVEKQRIHAEIRRHQPHIGSQSFRFSLFFGASGKIGSPVESFELSVANGFSVSLLGLLVELANSCAAAEAQDGTPAAGRGENRILRGHTRNRESALKLFGPEIFDEFVRSVVPIGYAPHARPIKDLDAEAVST